MDDQRADREGGGMRFRKLRIAWSVGCGVVCLLAVALWVRSYWWYDVFSVRIDNQHDQLVQSLTGELTWDGSASLAKDVEFFNWWAQTAEGVIRLKSGPTFLGFHWTTGGQRPLPIIPYWFPVVVFAALAAMSWLRWRFSLRGMFVATATVAMLLGAASVFTRMAPPPQPSSSTTAPDSQAGSVDPFTLIGD